MQARPPHAGFFPLNKFSTVPLLMKAARTAARFQRRRREKGVHDSSRHARASLRKAQTATGAWRITGVDTSNGFIALAPAASRSIALGTLESARLALVSFDGTGIPTLPLMGKNLIAHLRSNLVFRVPRAAIPGLSPTTNELQASALFVKGRAQLQTVIPWPVPPADHRHRRRQSWAPRTSCSGKSRTSTSSTNCALRPTPTWPLRSAASARCSCRLQQSAAHPSRVDLDPGIDEYSVRRAIVTLTATQRDNDLWAAMDAAMARWPTFSPTASRCNDSYRRFRRRPLDGLGTTHHETGTLWMGTDPTKSVTDPDGRFHHTENLYAAGPCLFPSIGSPNPMLTGIALARRTGDTSSRRRRSSPRPASRRSSTAKHRRLEDVDDPQSAGRDNPGSFLVRRGALEAQPGTDLGLLWLTRPAPPRYVLRLSG